MQASVVRKVNDSRLDLVAAPRLDLVAAPRPDLPALSKLKAASIPGMDIKLTGSLHSDLNFMRLLKDEEAGTHQLADLLHMRTTCRSMLKCLTGRSFGLLGRKG